MMRRCACTMVKQCTNGPSSCRVVDNRSKRRREKGKLLQDFSSFAVQYREQTVHKISPQLALATFQFLSSSLDPFKSDFISESVLRRLMQHGLVIRYIRVKDKDKQKNDPETIIYQQVRAFICGTFAELCWQQC